MKQERTLFIEGKNIRFLYPMNCRPFWRRKLLEGSVLGCLDAGAQNDGKTEFKGIPYVIPSMEYATEELVELILRRHLGLPWLIDETDQLRIRETGKRRCRKYTGRRVWEGRRDIQRSGQAGSVYKEPVWIL